jgi:Uma2 family endonuclease
MELFRPTSLYGYNLPLWINYARKWCIMASQITTSPQQAAARQAAGQESAARRVPPLRAGDRLARPEFERRYEAMPRVTKAELIEGVVYMPSPVSAEDHAEPHFDFITWLGVYRAHTPGVRGGDNGTLRLDWDNEPQPDGYLRLLEQCGGQSRVVEGYIEGAPELVVEIAASSASYDLHDKLNAYRRNGVREYVVWRVWDQAVDWFVLRDGRYEPLPIGDDGLYKSEVFPGLWLDVRAALAGEAAGVLAVLQQGLASTAHAAYVDKLRAMPQ